MVYTKMTKAALKLCFEAHKEQVDKSGIPYVFHPFHVAEQVETEEEVCVALLHDVMEDSDIAVDDIRAAGMSESVVEALLLLTHDPDVEYMDYISALSGNAIARKVKLADLRHNSDLSRLDTVTDRDLERAGKYAQAIGMLQFADRYQLTVSDSAERQGKIMASLETRESAKRSVLIEDVGQPVSTVYGDLRSLQESRSFPRITALSRSTSMERATKTA